MDKMEKCTQYLANIKGLNEKLKRYITDKSKKRGIGALVVTYQEEKEKLKILEFLSETLDRLEKILEVIIDFNLNRICNKITQFLKLETKNIEKFKVYKSLKVIPTFDEYESLKEKCKQSEDLGTFLEFLRIESNGKLKPLLVFCERYSISGSELEDEVYITYAEVLLIKEGLNKLKNFIENLAFVISTKPAISFGTLREVGER